MLDTSPEMPKLDNSVLTSEQGQGHFQIWMFFKFRLWDEKKKLF